MVVNANNVREYLFSISKKEYKDFIDTLVPNSDVIGIRIPILREIAKEIVKGDWRLFLEEILDEYFEERMLYGMVIGYAKTDVEEILKYLEKFVPRINSWGVCDSVVSTLKIVKRNKELFWDFIQKYLHSNEEFQIRFAVVIILQYFIEDKYIDEIIEILDNITHEAYYVKMAVAWAISYCYVKYPDKTLNYLKNNNLDDFTFNKAIQKTIESFRVDENNKNMLKTLRRRNRK